MSDAETLLRLHYGGPGYCVDCGESLAYGCSYFEVDGPDHAYCEECTDAWLEDAQEDSSEYSDEYSDDECFTWECASCEADITTSMYVVDPSDDSCYCLDCGGVPPTVSTGGPSGKRARNDGAQVEAANAARNAANIKALRERFPSYCSHQLYFVHVRGKANRGCAYGDADKCERGSHASPLGLALRTRDLDLDFD